MPNLGAWSSNSVLPLGNMVRAFGAVEGYTGCYNGGWVQAGNGALGVWVSSPYNCAFVLRSSLLVINVGAGVWSRADFALRANGADRAGYVSRGRHVVTAHNALYWQTVVLESVFQLAAGVPYWFGVYMPLVQNDGYLAYHTAWRHQNMFGYTLGEGV